MKLVRFGVDNPVIANLLMAAIIFAGIVAAFALRREFFPETDPEEAVISLPYPGASPEEIEQTLAIKVEDKLDDLNEVDELHTSLTEGGGTITASFPERQDPDKALDKIEREIDSLQDLPEEAEEITATLLERRLPVIRLAVFGEVDEAVRKQAIRTVRDDLRSLPQMGEVVIGGVRDYQVRVDVQSEAIWRNGISLPDVAGAIRQWMREIPGGTVRGEASNVKVRTMGVAERSEAIKQIVLRSDSEGRSVRVGDVAQVSDGFVDDDVITRFNGEPAALLTVFKLSGQDTVEMARKVRAYVRGRQGKPIDLSWFDRLGGSDRLQAWKLGANSVNPLPEDLTIAMHADLARFVESRLDLLTRNAFYGGILVFITLLVFLNWRVAMWVGVGLATALLGTLALMAATDVTLNLLTMFGLIVVLGLLVDDAIVVAENVQRRHDEGELALHAANHGTTQVFWPVVATVTTSIVAFVPLSFIKGNIGDMLGALPAVVACALIMSLIEAVFILPSHMAHTLSKRDQVKGSSWAQRLRQIEAWRDAMVMHRFVPFYQRVLDFLLRRRYVTISVAIAVLIISLGVWAGGRAGFTFLPSSDAETVMIGLRMPVGTPIERTGQVVGTVERAASNQSEVASVASQIGTQSNIETGTSQTTPPHVAQLFIELVPVQDRDRRASDVVASIRQALEGKIDAVERLRFSEITGGPGGPAISIEVRGRDDKRIDAALADLKQLLGRYDGVREIADDKEAGQLELQVRLKPGAAALGFTSADLAQQVRGALYGIDAHVFAEREEDIDVRVRLDEQTRQSIWSIENFWLVSPRGEPVPLSQVAEIREASAYATIRRIQGQRGLTVTADTDPAVSPESITTGITTPQTAPPGWASWMPGFLVQAMPQEKVGPSELQAIRNKYPNLQIAFGGRQEQMADAFATLPLGLAAAIVMIYVILATLFSSYLQPLVVLSVVPFALVGVIWGHLIMGYDLTFLSMIGFVALTGIVVNDSLILVQFYNEQRREGHEVFESLLRAGKARVRAIFLTTITTVLGLTPLILEQSFQAKFLIPMAIAIAGGLISATTIVLIVLPCLILALDDLKALLYYLWNGTRRDADRAGEAIATPAPAKG